jgi:sarcosine oxidase subunit alpha
MRIEKGHPAGNELNGDHGGRSRPGRMMSTKKDFIGRAMAMRPALVDPARPRLVGLIPVNGQSQIRAARICWLPVRRQSRPTMRAM